MVVLAASPSPKISDDSLEKALDWLVSHAAIIGEAKRRSVMADHMVRHVEAIETKMSNASSADARKTEARASKRYLEAIKEDAIAAGEYERLKALREAAALKIEAWRSEQANLRRML